MPTETKYTVNNIVKPNHNFDISERNKCILLYQLVMYQTAILCLGVGIHKDKRILVCAGVSGRAVQNLTSDTGDYLE